MRAVLPLLLFLSTAATAAAAQSRPEVGIDLGAATLTGAAGEHRSLGANGVLSLGVNTREPGVGVRAEIAWTHIPGDGTPGDNLGWRYGDFSSRSVRVSVIPTLPLPVEPVRVYGVLGAGAYDLRVTDQENPYGITGGINMGFGVRAPFRGAHFVAELQGVMLFTDFGSQEVVLPFYAPLTLGVRL